MIVLVSEAFDGVPWLERVYQAGSLWDAGEMGAPADVHCYTPAELERRAATLPARPARVRARRRPARGGRRADAVSLAGGRRAPGRVTNDR